MNPRIIAVLALGLGACSSNQAPPPMPPPSSTAVKPKIPDLTRSFPGKNRKGVEIVEQGIAGSKILPGGNVGTYQAGGKSWQLFLIPVKSAEAAAILLLDYKSTLSNPAYVPAFGAYAGHSGATHIFVLQKGPYLAGIAGLNDKDADPIAREFAARIN